MKLRVHATVDVENINSIQDAYYAVEGVIGKKIMERLGIPDHEIVSALGITSIRGNGIDLSIAMDPDVRITLYVGGSGVDLNFSKSDTLEDIANSVMSSYNSFTTSEESVA